MSDGYRNGVAENAFRGRSPFHQVLMGDESVPNAESSEDNRLFSISVIRSGRWVNITLYYSEFIIGRVEPLFSPFIPNC